MRDLNNKGLIGVFEVAAIAIVAFLIGFVVFRLTSEDVKTNVQPEPEIEQVNPASSTDGPVDEETGTEADESETDSETASQVLHMTLNYKKISIDVSDSRYDDIVAELKKGDAESGSRTKYVVYSKDLLKRVNTSNDLSVTDTNGCNNVIDVYSWDNESEGAHSKNVGTANGKYVHAGFSGPCDPSSDPDLSNEMIEFRDYIVAKISAEL